MLDPGFTEPRRGQEWPQRSCPGNDQQEKMPLTVKSTRTRESLEALYGKAAFRS
jgi:hypothetical protein